MRTRKHMTKTTAMMVMMLFIAYLISQMIQTQSLERASSTVFLCMVLMMGAFRFAGGRAPRKALAAGAMLLLCGALFWSGVL
ncbi:MAG: hypothetical protein AB4911_21305 [Oscillochloridaceae bacterium umkhey_bin13]